MRKARIIISAFVFFSIVVFLFIVNQKNVFLLRLSFLTQFSALLTSFLTGIVFLAIPLVILLALTVVFGRVYCSFICPLGTFQDYILGIRNAVKKKKFSFHKGYPFIRYSLFAITVFTYLFGSYFILSLFEPLSVFIRTFTLFIQPVISYVSYLGGSKLVFAFIPPLIISFIISTFFLAVVMILFRGRLYCNTLCPVGSFLSIIEGFSLKKIAIENGCSKCMRCERTCKSECIDVSKGYVDNSRCVMCGSCLALGCEYIKYKSRIKQNPDERKRMLLASGGAFILGAFGFGLKKLVKNKNSSYVILPPASVNSSRFASRCTSCYTCVSACPTKVLTPSVSNDLRPEMRYERGYCEYECKLCSDVCPSNAISKISIDEKKRTQIGRAVFEREKCIVILNKEDCGACSEHCPTKALTNIDEDGLLVPKTNDVICIGCGACENVCPASMKAINVIPIAMQKIIAPATLIEEQKTGEQLEISDDFPF